MNKFYPKRLFLFLVALLLVLSTQASYLRNVPQRLVQPNGDIVNCFATGDEYYHWLHDEDGYTIVRNPITGFICYAILSDDELVASEYVVGKVSPASVGLTPKINISLEKMRELRENFLGLEKAYMIKKTGKYDGPVNVQSTGVINNIVVYIRFAGEAEYTVSQPSIGDQFNSTTPGVLSMHNYFDEVSYGTLNMETHFLPANDGTHIISYQDSHTRDYFQVYDATTNPTGYADETARTEREHTLLQSAINSIAGQLDPSLNIDNDGDGKVDNVCFIVQGTPGAWSSLLWPHKWQLHTKDAYINGKQVWIYNFQLQSVLGPSVLCHEMFHSIGAPDLYHYTDGTPDPVGVWDLMNSDRGQHMTQFMKWRYGKWLPNIPEITTSGVYTLNPVFTKDNSCWKVKSPFSPSDYFVIEYRKKENLDAVLPNQGLLIYRINTLVDGLGNKNGPPDELYVYRPNGSLTSEGTLNSAPFSADLGKTSFNDNTNPDPFLSNGAPGGLNISNISAIGATMSFHIDIFQPLTKDVGVTKLLTPVSSSSLTSSEKVKVIVTNLGLTEIASGLQICYKLNGGAEVAETYPKTFASGSSTPYEFTKTIDCANPGVYTLEVYTKLDGDQNAANDKVTATIYNPIPIEYFAANASTSIAPYTEIAGGSAIAVSPAKDGLSGATDIGFTFKYCGISYTKFILSTNGFIKLGDQNPSSSALYFTDPQTAEGGVFNSPNAADNCIIAPFAHDLVAGAGGAEYRIEVSGTTPNRIATIQFKNVRDNGTKRPNQFNSMNFQIKLYETSNIIDFVYGVWTTSTNPSEFKTSLCGLRGLGNFPAQLMAVNKGSTAAWSSVTFTNGNYSTTATLNYGNPNAGNRAIVEAGRFFRFIPKSGQDASISEIVSPVSRCGMTDFETVTTKIKNLSGETLSNVYLTYKVDAGSLISEKYSGTIAPYASVVYTFNQKADFSAAGPHNLVVSAVITNDIDNTNDSKTAVVTNKVGKTLPFTQDFEGSFPPSEWEITNPDNSYTWEQKAATGNGASTKAAFINFYDYQTLGQKDALTTPLIALTGIPKLTFNYAYAYNGYDDGLAVYIVTQCGAIVSAPVFSKIGTDLTTINQQGAFTPSQASHWKQITIDLAAYVGQSIQIRFVTTNEYGNNLYLDDICVKDYTPITPVANFSANKTTANAGIDEVAFTDLSTGPGTSWEWTFAGGTPATSTLQNPVVSYAAVGTYDVTLKVTNPAGNNTVTKTAFISVVTPNNIFSAIPPIANGSSANSRGPNPAAKYQRTATLYSIKNAAGANEINLNVGDVIKTLGFNIGTPLAAANTGSIKIYLQNTTSGNFSKSLTWATTITDMTLVYDGALTIPNTAGFYDVTLAAPFTYTGGNLYMAYEWTIGTAGAAGLIYNCNTSNGSTLYTATSSTTPPATLGAGSTYRPQIRVSRDVLADDASIVEVYTLGQVIAGNFHTVQAVVKNNGYQAITGKVVTLNVTGGQTFTNTQTVDLGIGQTKVVTFDSYTVAASGTNTVTVSVPADDRTTNDSKAVTQVITADVISVNPTTPVIANSYGSSSSPLTFLTIYEIMGKKTISKVSATIANNSASVGKVMYAIVVDMSLNIIGKSANYTIQASDLGKNVDFPIVMGTLENTVVLAGLVKPDATSYFPFAVEMENPVRSDTYYSAYDITGFSDISAWDGNNLPYRFINSITVSDLVNVTGISVTPTASIKVYETTTLTATLTPVTSTYKSVVWSSDNTAVATVDQTGTVTAKAVGTATIKVTSVDNTNGNIFAECTVTVTDADHVTDVDITKATTSIIVGGNETLLYTVNPGTATNKNVSWSTSDPLVATVSATGNVVAVKPGTADITITTIDGGKTDVCTVTVTPILVTSITIAPTTLSLYTTQVSAALVPTVLPANASNKTYDWSSDDITIATVDATGKVTGVSAGGPVNIKATAKDGSGVVGTCAVTVTSKVDLISISLNALTKDLDYILGAQPTFQLVVTLNPLNASVGNVTWSVGNSTIATVSSTGLVTAVSLGTTVVTATSVDNNAITATCTINVVRVPVTAIALSNTTASLNIGDTKQITVSSITPSTATNKFVTWSSSDEAVATVSPLGIVSALSAGTTNIVATSVSDPGITSTCAVTVAQNTTVASVSLNSTYKELPISGTYQLAATVFATPINSTIDQTVTWSSSDNAKVSVVNGLVTVEASAVSGDTYTITAASTITPAKTASCNVKVVTAVSSVALDIHSKKAPLLQEFDLVATVNPSGASNKEIQWSSDNTTIASVNAAGHVVALSDGVVNITATSKSDQTKFDVCQVFVDNTKPVITLLGNSDVELVYGATYTDAGATASDNVDGNITSSIVVTGLPTNTSPVGSYLVHYNVSDAVGNVATEVTRTVTLTKAPLTVTADNKTKVYGSANPTLTFAYSGFVNGETATALTTAPTASTTVTATTAVGVQTGAITVAGGVATNYAFNYVAGNFTITAATLTVTGATVTSKVYDGTTAATIAGGTLVGIIGSDDVTLATATTGTFAAKTVGTAVVVTPAMTLAGTKASNYTLTQPTLSGSITAKALTVTGATVTTKVYDGTTTATITGATLSGVIVNDVVTLGNATTGTFADKNVGNGKVVTTAMTISGADAGNYTLTQPTLTGNITPATGVDPNDLNSVQIYSDTRDIFVNIPVINGAAQLEVYNILGSKVYQNVNLNQGLNKVDKYFNSGKYIIRVIVDNKVFTQKVVLQK